VCQAAHPWRGRKDSEQGREEEEDGRNLTSKDTWSSTAVCSLSNTNTAKDSQPTLKGPRRLIRPKGDSAVCGPPSLASGLAAGGGGMGSVSSTGLLSL
jgi:hypothetical protein